MGPLRAPVLVVGFGNELAGDDGVGPAVASRLEQASLPAGCRVVDEAGCDALLLSALWQGEGEVWIVDAVARGAPPGTIHRFAHDDVLALRQRHGSAHQLSLPEALRCLAIAFPSMAAVRYRMWGVEPLRAVPPAGMSAPVAAAAATVADEIRQALAAR
jgi:hydrogenase maturation protease